MIRPSIAIAEIGDQIATTNGTKNAGTAITMRDVLRRIASSHISSRTSRRPLEAESQSAQKAGEASRKLPA
jgi:hypothetical protein